MGDGWSLSACVFPSWVIFSCISFESTYSVWDARWVIDVLFHLKFCRTWVQVNSHSFGRDFEMDLRSQYPMILDCQNDCVLVQSCPILNVPENFGRSDLEEENSRSILRHESLLRY